MKKSAINNKIIQVTAFAFIFFLLAVSNQANLRKSLAGKIFSFGNYYFNGGAYDLGKAESRYKLALFFYSRLPLAHYQLGRIYFVENKSKEALEEIDKELAMYPDNKRSYYIRGLIDGYASDYQIAISDFNQFVTWAPREWAGYNDLAWAYYKNENYDQAKKTVLEGLTIFPDNVWLLNGLGAAELSLGDFSESQKTMEKVSALADKLNIKDWIRAYPGNNPADAKYNLDVFKENVGSNLALAKNQIAIGGNFAAACASGVCAGTHYNCASGTLGYTAEYADQWQWWCMGQGHPGDTDQLCVEMKGGGNAICSDTVYYGSCGVCTPCTLVTERVGDCRGSLVQIISDCAGFNPNCFAPCCTDTTWSPDPSTVCSGTPFTQTSNCGNTRPSTGTKNCACTPNWTGYSCSHTNSGCATCGTPQVASCCRVDTNNCATPSIQCDLSKCSGCNDISCPACASTGTNGGTFWKEVAP